MHAQALLESSQESGELERRRLAPQVAEGHRARQEFVEANLQLVVAIVKRRRPGLELLDLVQAGNIGLMRPSPGSTRGSGNKFSTYGLSGPSSPARDQERELTVVCREPPTSN